MASGGAWWGAADVSIDRVKAWEVSTLFCFCAGVPILAEVLASSLPPSWTETILKKAQTSLLLSSSLFVTVVDFLVSFHLNFVLLRVGDLDTRTK